MKIAQALRSGLFSCLLGVSNACCSNRVRTADGSSQGNLPMKTCFQSRSSGPAGGVSIPLGITISTIFVDGSLVSTETVHRTVLPLGSPKQKSHFVWDFYFGNNRASVKIRNILVSDKHKRVHWKVIYGNDIEGTERVY
jgi:hypothetical protein